MEPSFSVRMEGQTDMTKLTVVIYNYMKAPNNVVSLISPILSTKANVRYFVSKNAQGHESHLVIYFNEMKFLFHSNTHICA